jgi:hypothetical protein
MFVLGRGRLAFISIFIIFRMFSKGEILGSGEATVEQRPLIECDLQEIDVT